MSNNVPVLFTPGMPDYLVMLSIKQHSLSQWLNVADQSMRAGIDAASASDWSGCGTRSRAMAWDPTRHVCRVMFRDRPCFTQRAWILISVSSENLFFKVTANGSRWTRRHQRSQAERLACRRRRTGSTLTAEVNKLGNDCLVIHGADHHTSKSKYKVKHTFDHFYWYVPIGYVA